MMRLICAATFCLMLCATLPASSVCAQVSRNDIPTTGPWDSAEQMRKSQERDARNSARYGPDGSRAGGRGDYSRYGLINFKMPDDQIERQEKLLRPKKADLAANEQFLKQPHVGLLRLMPAKAGKVVSVEKLGKEGEGVYAFPGNGAYYSFTKLNHVPDMWADLKLIDGKFEVAFGENVLGALTMLGDVPLDSLTLDSQGVSALAKYAPPSRARQAKSEYERFKGGMTFEGHLFKTSLPVEPDMSYALRSIAYHRSDLLVALRVLRVEDDGSVLLQWKRLGKFPKMQLKADKR